MARPPKTPKIDHGGNRTRMDDLDDHMLIQILIRLPNCEMAFACTVVNKRWCSLISDRNFPVQFVNHKKKITTLLKGSGFDHEDVEQPWTFVINVLEAKENYFYDGDNKIKFITKFIFESPKLSLEFLPCNSFIAKATFKDLVLCFDNSTLQGDGLVYYITNPLTKQWVALPPCPVDKHKPKRKTSVVLICQPPYNHTQHYKFRVVIVRHPRMDRRKKSLGKFNLVVYCSEIGEWKEINLKVPKEVGQLGPVKTSEIVVCNGIIYFKSGLCLVALDPFDVNDDSDTTLDARVMPPLPDFGYLKESSGQLLVVHAPETRGIRYFSYREDGTSIELQMVVWKLDLNKAPLVWETTFQGLCKGTVSIDLPNYTRLERSINARDIGVHPYNDKLIYLHIFLEEDQVVLCDTRTGYITPSKSFPNCYVRRFHRLEHQWWPTSVPAPVQCLTAEQNLPPLQLKSSDDSC